MSLLSEIKRRHVLQVAVVYAILNMKHNTYRVPLFDKPEFKKQRKRLGHHD